VNCYIVIYANVIEMAIVEPGFEGYVPVLQTIFVERAYRYSPLKTTPAHPVRVKTLNGYADVAPVCGRVALPLKPRRLFGRKGTVSVGGAFRTPFFDDFFHNLINIYY